MATAETVDMGSPHQPKEESIKAFKEIEHDLKQHLVHTRHEQNKHEPEFFAAAKDLSDHALAGFGPSDFVLVRVATSAYGLHLFGKVRIPDLPESGPAFIHFRAFGGGPNEPAKFHSIKLEEFEQGGTPHFKAIFTKDDPLEWFDA